MSESGGGTGDLVKIEFAVPDEDWIKSRLDKTRFETLDDFITQVVDEAVVLGREMAEISAEESVTVEVPESAVKASEEMFDGYGDDFDDISEILSFLVTQLYVQERMRYRRD